MEPPSGLSSSKGLQTLQRQPGVSMNLNASRGSRQMFFRSAKAPECQLDGSLREPLRDRRLSQANFPTAQSWKPPVHESGPLTPDVRCVLKSTFLLVQLFFTHSPFPLQDQDFFCCLRALGAIPGFGKSHGMTAAWGYDDGHL